MDVYLRLLGHAELRVDGSPAPVDTRKALALGAYLAVEGATSRDTMCALLWPEVDDARARAALRRTLSALRAAAGARAVLADRRSVALGAEVTADIDEFRAARAETTTHGHVEHEVCPRCLPALGRAAGIYRGDFLAGFSLRDAPGFDDWTRLVSEGLRSEMAAVLERSAAGYAADGDYRRAIEVAHRWIDLDPLHEPAYRQAMLLSAWAGDRPGAVDSYRRCVSVLNDELGVAPLEETTELHEAILDDDLPRPLGVRRRVEVHRAPSGPAPEVPLIGRRAELELLERELMWAATGGRVVMVTGDSWMGKTRILEEFLARSSHAGHRVLLARGYPAERTLPYGIVVQLLRSAVAGGWLDPETLPAWALAEAGRILPGIATATEPLDGLSETRLHDAVATVLFSMAKGRALVVEIDDGQWIDPASASMLSYLTHRLGDVGVLLVVALPSPGGEPTGAGTIRDTLGAGAGEITLDPLTAEDVAGLVDSPEAVIERTGGDPAARRRTRRRRERHRTARRDDPVHRLTPRLAGRPHGPDRGGRGGARRRLRRRNPPGDQRPQ
jgi:DNA-binding SARP family transcriptional activator